MWLQLTVKKTCCTRENCTFCAPYYKTVTLSYFGCKSSTLKVLRFGNAQEVLDCPLLSFQRFLYLEIGLFFFLLFQLHEGVGGEKPALATVWFARLSPLWPHPLPLFCIPTPPHAHQPLAGFWTREVLSCLWAFALAWHILLPFRHLICSLNCLLLSAEIFLIIEIFLLPVILVPNFPGTFSFIVLYCSPGNLTHYILTFLFVYCLSSPTRMQSLWGRDWVFFIANYTWLTHSRHSINYVLNEWMHVLVTNTIPWVTELQTLSLIEK